VHKILINWLFYLPLVLSLRFSTYKVLASHRKSSFITMLRISRTCFLSENDSPVPGKLERNRISLTLVELFSEHVPDTFRNLGTEKDFKLVSDYQKIGRHHQFCVWLKIVVVSWPLWTENIVFDKLSTLSAPLVLTSTSSDLTVDKRFRLDRFLRFSIAVCIKKSEGPEDILNLKRMFSICS